jgi:uncharacterized protein YgbK (DUF1537 family)
MTAPLLTWYGDDFSGSTDVMEVLALAGLRANLFLKPPTPEQLARIEGLQAVGLAGISRSLPVAEMDRELLSAFAALKQLGAPLVHYKVCSTFDSSPQIGSIGRAIDLGQQAFSSPFVPLVVGAPALGRYCVFGNLFARSGGDSPVYRLDRHPTMSRHPVTPMHESDLRVHLAQQTRRRIDLLDVQQLAGAAPEEHLEKLLASGAEIVLFDILSDEQLPRIGRLVWSHARGPAPLLAVGSSGLEYALATHWRQIGLVPTDLPRLTAPPVDRLLVVSGSCSPVTQRQIAWAVAHGFAEIPLGPRRWTQTLDVAEIVDRVRGVLNQGCNVIVHASRGPDDPRIPIARAQLAASGSESASAERLGTALGRIIHSVLESTPIRRVVVTGGDTAGFVARELAIERLEFVAPIAPGSPICRVHAADASLEGAEILFKGGQVGKTDLFESVRQGKPQS